MDLLEYQAKEWFREMGIPVLLSQRIDRPSDLKGLKIPYPVVLKSQVRTGGRGKAGGVRFVENTIDAIAAAQTILNLPIWGEFPEVLLAEAKYDADREFYLAVVLDSVHRRPLLLGSPQGGIDVESAPDLLRQVVVDQEFSPFYARRLAVKMGLQGELLQTVSDIVEKMYRLFVLKDLDLIEINPLGVSPTDEVMALDGKVTVNDRAIARHPDIALMAEKIRSFSPFNFNNGRPNDRQIASSANPSTTAVEFCNWDAVERLSGQIGILGNGAGLVMATLDLVTQAGSKPATCLNVGHGNSLSDPTIAANSFEKRVEQGLEFLCHDKSIQVVLINILGTVSTAAEVAGAIANFVERRDRLVSTRHSHLPRLVVRLAGSELSLAKQRLATVGVPLLENLDEAIAQAVRFVKSPSGKK